MKETEPIRTREEINSLLRYLQAWNSNYYMAAMILIHWGLRVSDALALKVEDVLAGEGKRIRIVDNIIITERKTGKRRTIVISDKMKNNLQAHIRRIARNANGEIDISSPLIVSQKRGENGKRKALSRVAISRVICKACAIIGIKGHIGAHGLRKTFAYHLWSEGTSVDVIQKIFGHSSVWVTHRYACIPIDYESKAYHTLNFGFIAKPRGA